MPLAMMSNTWSKSRQPKAEARGASLRGKARSVIAGSNTLGPKNNHFR